MGIGNPRVNYKIRDAAFSRQRYWGEPFPIVWKNGIAYPLDEKELPLEFPKWILIKQVPTVRDHSPICQNGLQDISKPTRCPDMQEAAGIFCVIWIPITQKHFCSRAASDYWGQVDLYIGGTEHAVGHLLYSRMWTKFLFDLGYIGFDEPYRRLVNQGMIQGSSRFVYRIEIKWFE